MSAGPVRPAAGFGAGTRGRRDGAGAGAARRPAGAPESSRGGRPGPAAAVAEAAAAIHPRLRLGDLLGELGEAAVRVLELPGERLQLARQLVEAGPHVRVGAEDRGDLLRAGSG